jgi:hypothetical protein
VCGVILCTLAHPAYAQEAGKQDPWSMNVSLSGSYEGNALFTGPNGDEEFSHQVQATLGRAWLLKRGSARLSFGGAQPFYNKSTSLNDFTYNVGSGLSFALTRRLAWTGSANLSSGFARDSKELIDAGLVLPSVTVRSGSSSSTFGYLLTRRTTLSWTVNQSGVGFSSVLFSGGSTIGSTVGLSRKISHSQAISVTQQYQWTSVAGTGQGINGVMGTWQGSFGRDWSIHAGGGVSGYRVPAIDDFHASMTMTAGITKPLARGQSLSANYDRGVEQTYGLDAGNHLVDNVTGAYTLELTRNVSTNFSGTYSRGWNPLTPEVKIIGQVGNANISYQMTSKLRVGLGAAIYTRLAPPDGQITSYRMYTSLTYGTTWH